MLCARPDTSLPLKLCWLSRDLLCQVPLTSAAKKRRIRIGGVINWWSITRGRHLDAVHKELLELFESKRKEEKVQTKAKESKDKTDIKEQIKKEKLEKKKQLAKDKLDKTKQTAKAQPHEKTNKKGQGAGQKLQGSHNSIDSIRENKIHIS